MTARAALLAPAGSRRLFIAAFPPRDAQAALRTLAASLQSAPGGRAVSWVREAHLHLTLRFLGDCDAAHGEAAAEAMRAAAAAAHGPFTVTIGALGAFPDAKRARVLYAGLDAGADPLRELSASLTRQLSRRGFARAEEAFVPHVTLGRPKAPSDWTRALSATLPPISFEVEHVWLVESTRTPAGSRYHGREQAALGG